MGAPSSDVTLQPASDEDAPALAEFLNACTLAHQGIARSSPGDAVTRLHTGGSDPSADSLVAREGGRIVGFAHLWADGGAEVKFFARTHPETRGRGVGSALLSWCEDRALEVLPSAPWTTTTWANDLDAPALLERHGFASIRHFLKMTIDAGAVSEEPPLWPGGVEVVAMSQRPELESSLFDAWQKAFAGHWGRAPESEAEFWKERREDKLAAAFAFDPTLWLLASRGSSVVGFCLCELGESEGQRIGRVAEIGVVPSNRGTGVGRAVLREGLQELRRRGAVSVVLDVDVANVTGALRLYEGAGMAPTPGMTIWEKRHSSR